MEADAAIARTAGGTFAPGQSGNAAGKNQWSDGLHQYTPRIRASHFLDRCVEREIGNDPECGTTYGRAVVKALKTPLAAGHLALIEQATKLGILERVLIAGIAADRAPDAPRSSVDQLADIAESFGTELASLGNATSGNGSGNGSGSGGRPAPAIDVDPDRSGGAV